MILGDLICDPSGRLSEAKVFAVAFKIAMLWAFIQHTVLILGDWMVLSVVVASMIAPDLLKKILTMRAGGLLERKT